MLSRSLSADYPGTDAEVLNPALYRRLTTIFGKVRISKPGQAATPDDRYGESYNVDCPLCGDQRGRLTIPHMWGVPDPETGRDGKFLAKCWNEQCLEHPPNLDRLWRQVYVQLSWADRQNIQIRKGTVAQPWNREPVDLPGVCVPLTEAGPGHPVNLYLMGRGFDPVALDRDYGVCYCQKTTAADTYCGARDRIIVPIREHGHTIAWQGRRIGDMSVRPKYYNLPGGWKSQVLYGIDDAAAFPFVVVVEGVTSVWRIGAPAVATLGKQVSPTQLDLLGERWPLAMIWADDEAAWESAAKDYQRLTKTYGTIIWPFRAADGRDPAEHSH